MERYSKEERELIEKYFEMLRWTRKSGKLSESIRKKQLEYFLKYDKNIVLRALKIHIEKYPTMREEYTRGIIRNLEREGIGHGCRGDGRALESGAKSLAERNRAAADAIGTKV
ncbi:MAG: hypothetical protein Q4D65_11010 [Peptostreptococcaceae bacterium]|nr:hypothetical protein [Peptostreptococcaceae bacterium]